MLNSDIRNRPSGQGKTFKKKKPLPRISLKLHTMPHSSEHNFYNWMIWGAVILVILLIVTYFILS